MLISVDVNFISKVHLLREIQQIKVCKYIPNSRCCLQNWLLAVLRLYFAVKRVQCSARQFHHVVEPRAQAGYKIPNIDCIKLRCKNSASGKLNTEYLKSTASSNSLSQNCWDTFVSFCLANVGVQDLVTETQSAALGGKMKAQKGEKKNSVFFKCPNYCLGL